LTIDESKDFLRNYAFVSFPSVREWLLKTEHAEQTFLVWARVLQPLDRKECEVVIDKWLEGTIEAPAAYQRDLFATHLRSCAMHLRGEANRSRALVEQRQTLAEGQGVKRFSLATDDVYATHWVPRLAAIEIGELDRDVALSEFKAILEGVFK
jgi:ATP/maltotriose-dependent transcriptional regulator MalT